MNYYLILMEDKNKKRARIIRRFIITGIILLTLLGIIFGPGLCHRIFPGTFIIEIIPVDRNHFILLMQDEFEQNFFRCRNIQENCTIGETYLPFQYSSNNLDINAAPYFEVYNDMFIYRIIYDILNADLDIEDTIDKLICLDIKTGKILWIHKIDSEGEKAKFVIYPNHI